jgi:hypothetical protein
MRSETQQKPSKKRMTDIKRVLNISKTKEN